MESEESGSEWRQAVGRVTSRKLSVAVNVQCSLQFVNKRLQLPKTKVKFSCCFLAAGKEKQVAGARITAVMC